MIPPPLGHQHRERGHGEPAPPLEVRALHRGGRDRAVPAEAELAARGDGALGRVEQVRAEGQLVRAERHAIGALPRGLAEDELPRLRPERDLGDLAVRRDDLRRGVLAEVAQRKAESVARVDEELPGLRRGRVEPVHGVGDEDREADAQRPGALQRVEPVCLGWIFCL